MTEKFDNYPTYITIDFREEMSLEQPVKRFPDVYGRKENAAITSDNYQIFRHRIITFTLNPLKKGE